MVDKCVGDTQTSHAAAARRIDAATAAVARRQQGNIHRLQLIAIGLTGSGIAHRVRAGRLYRVHAGVYSVGRPPLTPLERASAAVLACGPGAALSHGSALALWGLQQRWDTPFHVIVPGDRRPRGIQVHRSRSLATRDLTTQLGIKVTTPARTVLDCAPGLSDRALSRSLDDGRHAGILKLGALADLLARCPRHPGASRIMAHLSTGDGPTRSDWEIAFPAFCARHGLPRPVMSTTVCGHEVDALFVAEKLIIELDSWEFHRDRAAFETDRDRDADTLAGGYATVRITSKRTRDTPGKEAARLRNILARRRAAAPPVELSDRGRSRR